jgi:GNAT superfamily N-acetyltransferase/uncharacterized damage-inducible protein DinB
MADIVRGIRAEFRRYKRLADEAMAQVADGDLAREPEGGGNSIATLVWHIAGNLRSRFTDFRTSDGEKPWRRRDEEFVPRPVGREEVLSKWESGWSVLLRELDALTDADLDALVTIRKERTTIAAALQRSVAHAAYHCGQIVYRAKELRGTAWLSLSIPLGQSDTFNRTMGFDAEPEPLAIEPMSAASAEALALIEELDAELRVRYPTLAPHGLREQDVVNPLTVFLIGRIQGDIVACGATRPVEPGIAEIKRMYVRPAARGRGYSKQMLAALESSARASGVTRLILETGDRQPEAIALYRSAGYVTVPLFGEYHSNSFSRCFAKTL